MFSSQENEGISASLIRLIRFLRLFANRVLPYFHSGSLEIEKFPLNWWIFTYFLTKLADFIKLEI